MDTICILWLAIIAVAFGLHWLLVRPFLRRLEDRIPTGKCYRATLTGSRRQRDPIACPK